MSKIVFWRWCGRRGPPTKISCLAFFLSIEVGLEESNQPPTQSDQHVFPTSKCVVVLVDKLSTHWRPRFPSLNPILVDDDVELSKTTTPMMMRWMAELIDARTNPSPSPSSYLFVVGHWASRQLARMEGEGGRAWAGTPRQ